ncbi:MAG TPA: hypothetical protein VIK33_08030 [Anaerolineae bacterium]
MSEEHAKILQMVADKKISADEAAHLLAALPIDDEPETRAEPSPPLEMPTVGNLWLIPMYLGLVLFVCGALAVFPLYSPGGGSWLLAVCGWPIFLLGLLTMIAAYVSRRSRWIHVRVTNIHGPMRSVRFSFPLPLRLTAWVLRIVARCVPRFKDTGIDETIVELNESLTGDQPLLVDVQEGEDGERVQVYIG